MVVQVVPSARCGGKKAAIGVCDTEEKLNGVNIRGLNKIKLRFGYSVSRQTLIFRHQDGLSKTDAADARVALHRMGDKRGTNRSKEQLSDFYKPNEADNCCIT